MSKPPRLKGHEGTAALDKGEYEARLEKLQHRLRLLQTSYITHGERAIILVEGWDASGKGGLIRRLIAELDPGHYHVWPIRAPDEHELQQHFLYRFWKRMPGRGEYAIFDRSWYGRVLVERVDELIAKPVWQKAYDEINQFEAMHTDNGTRIIKLFVHVTPDVQDERLAERLEQPWKRWKTGPDDYRNRAKRGDYLDAIDEMFDRTHTQAAPWYIVNGNNKRAARIAGLEIVAERLGVGIDGSYPPVDPELRRIAERALGRTLDLS